MDVETNEALAAVLQLLAKLYRFPADDATVLAFQGLVSEGDGEADDPFMRDADFARGARMFAESFGGDDARADAAKLMAKNDFHKLFVGPLTLLAAPWSTVYLDGGMLFGPTEHEVREEFHRQGFDIPEGTREPCDHIAYELQFLAEMHKRAAGMGCADGSGALEAARTFRRRFVDPWVPDFLAKVEAGARVGTYRGLALMTRGALRVEEGALRPGK